MHLVRLARSALALIVASALAILGMAVLPTPALAAGTTYYVSSTGSDSNSGTSSSTPWQSLAKVNGATFGPGDQVLFKAGDAWTGKLAPQGSGVAGSPITISSYGTGHKPAIDGGGAKPGTLVITTGSYITVTGLDIANRAATRDLRSGIVVDDALTTPLTGIALTNLSIHDVIGVSYPNAAWVEPGDGGIVVTGRSDSSTSMVNNLLVQDITINTVDDAGVRINTRNNSARATGVRINRVTVNNAGGNGLLLANTDHGVIEHSKVFNSGGRCGANAGLWGAMNDSPTYQYNEVAGQTTTGGDGYAFDLDFAQTNVTYQYNYAHDNSVGFLQMFYQTTGVFRYNIWQDNDGSAFTFYNSVNGIQIYNNTIYNGPGQHTAMIKVLGSTPANTSFKNNLFVNWGDGGYQTTGLVFDHNAYFGNHPAPEPAETGKIVADPLLVAPGVATNIDDTSGYKLRPSAPVIGAGIIIPGAPSVDYFGNPVSPTAAPNIGADNGTGLSAAQQVLTALAVDDSIQGTTDRTWAYPAGWDHCKPCVESSQFSQFEGSNSWSSTVNATATFRFTGTQVSLYGVVDPSHGIAGVSIDGGSEQLVDFYAPSRQGDRRLFTSAVLSSGAHTLTVRATGTKNASSTGTLISVDRADVVRTPLRIDDTVTGTGTNQIQYSGGWSSCGPCSPPYGVPPQFNNSNHWNGTTGATATLRFTGTQAAFRVVKDNNEGQVGISVDGGPEVAVDLYSQTRIGDLSVYTTPTLASGAHTMVVRVLGVKRAAATDDIGVVDGFDIYS